MPSGVTPVDSSAARDRRQQALVVAALGYAAAATIASLVAIRDDVPGEPLGVAPPLSVPLAVASGWGSGISPPWFMPLAAVVAAHRARNGSRAAAAVAGGVGLSTIAGHVVEPVTRRPRSWTRATAASVVLSVTASAALAAVGLRNAVHV